MQTIGKSKGNDQTVAQLRGTLFRLLEVTKNARKIDTEASQLCIRNCLMAIVILLTAGHNCIPANDPLLVRVCDEMMASLQDTITQKTAIFSCRSILLYQPKNDADRALVAALLPKIVQYVATDDESGVGNSKGLMAQVLITFFATLSGESCKFSILLYSTLCTDSLQVKIAMTVFIPALLSRAAVNVDRENEHAVYRDTAARLMEMASKDPAMFKGVVVGLTAEQRTFTEEILRAGAGSSASENASAQSTAPSIALKMSF